MEFVGPGNGVGFGGRWHDAFWVPHVGAFISQSVFSSVSVYGKVGVQLFNITGFCLLRFIISVSLFAAAMAAIERRTVKHAFEGRFLPLALGIGLINAFSNMLYFVGLYYCPAVVAGIMYLTCPAFTLVFGYLLCGERGHLISKAACILVSCFGAAIMVLASSDDGDNQSTAATPTAPAWIESLGVGLAGSIMLLISSMLYALYLSLNSLLMAEYPKNGPVTLNTISFSVCLIYYTVLLFVMEDVPSILDSFAENYLAVLYYAFIVAALGTFLPYLLMLYCIKRMSSSAYSVYLPVELLVMVGLSYFVFGTLPNRYQWIGGFILLIGMAGSVYVRYKQDVENTNDSVDTESSMSLESMEIVYCDESDQKGPDKDSKRKKNVPHDIEMDYLDDDNTGLDSMDRQNIVSIQTSSYDILDDSDDDNDDNDDNDDDDKDDYNINDDDELDSTIPLPTKKIFKECSSVEYISLDDGGTSSDEDEE